MDRPVTGGSTVAMTNLYRVMVEGFLNLGEFSGQSDAEKAAREFVSRNRGKWCTIFRGEAIVSTVRPDPNSDDIWILESPPGALLL